jgi:Flp pilus assembly pilin Flp
MFNPILRLIVATQVGFGRLESHMASTERGQSTVEYAMVLAGVAALVALVFTGKDLFGGFFTKAITFITSKLPG